LEIILRYSVFVLLLLHLVFLVLCHAIGWVERLRNDLFCVKLDIKPELNQLGLCSYL